MREILLRKQDDHRCNLCRAVDSRQARLFGSTGAHVETDEHVITSKGAGCAIEFGHAIVALALGKADADRVIEEMQCL